MKKIISALLLILPLLSGCFLIEKKTVILWTDIPEVASYVEIFNASQSDFRVEIVYSENPADYQKLTSDSAPDIVIAENLASNAVIRAFKPLQKMTEEGLLDPSVFYHGLYKLGCRDDIPYVLPVSFNIPAIMYRQNNLSENIEGVTISPEQLMKEAQLFNKKSSDKFRVMGFAPTWVPEFLIYNAFINSSGFSETENGSLIWNETKLNESIDFCRNWTESINQGYEEEQDFTLTYCYDPGYKLLNSGRIGFYFTDLRSFFTVPADDRATLEFKWLGTESSVPVSEDIVYIGIPAKSRKTKTAQQFVTWFLKESTQKKLMESAQFKRERSFGICNGLSSLKNVNEFVIPEYYKLLIGKIPPPDYFKFPENLPVYWMQERDDVILPWMEDRCSEKPQAGPLADLLKTWVLQQQNK